MDNKTTFDYWWKIIFFLIGGILTAGAAIYTITSLPLSFLVLVYFIGMSGGSVFCFWSAIVLIKEYFRRKKEDTEKVE